MPWTSSPELELEPTRRRLIEAGSLALLLQACKGASVPGRPDETGRSDPGETGDTADGGCLDPFADGELLDVLPFENDGSLPTETRLEEGLDGRYAIDLMLLDESESSPVIETDRFFIRTFEPTLDRTQSWVLRLRGFGEDEDLGLDDLPASTDFGAHLIECSGNSAERAFGLISAATWQGVALSGLLPEGEGLIEVRGVDEHEASSSHSTEGCSWIFRREDLDEAFLATGMNGEELPPDHGKPLRLMVPNWYGCSLVKWVDRIRLVEADVAATSQMIEFASRTHQNGTPAKASDYAPARMQVAAMPIRVERWQVDGQDLYRVIGVVWGGDEPVTALQIRFGSGSWDDVVICPETTDNPTWHVWVHAWRPAASGDVDIVLRVDADVPQVRLDSGFYLRTVRIDATG